MSEQLPDWDNMELDFSEYHPLDHSIWRCGHYPGGWRRHFSHRWQFQWRDRAGRWKCLLGRHKMRTWYRRTEDRQFAPQFRSCERCHRREYLTDE